MICVISAKILVNMWDLVRRFFAGSAFDPVPDAGIYMCSGPIFASSIESLKNAHTSKFTSFCESVELAPARSYIFL